MAERDPQIMYKTPREKIPVTFDFSIGDLLPEAATISARAISGGLTMTGDAVSGRSVQCYLAGGTAGVEYRMVCKATGSDGTIAELVVYVRVVEP